LGRAWSRRWQGAGVPCALGSRRRVPAVSLPLPTSAAAPARDKRRRRGAAVFVLLSVLDRRETQADNVRVPQGARGHGTRCAKGPFPRGRRCGTPMDVCGGDNSRGRQPDSRIHREHTRRDRDRMCIRARKSIVRGDRVRRLSLSPWMHGSQVASASELGNRLGGVSGIRWGVGRPHGGLGPPISPVRGMVPGADEEQHLGTDQGAVPVGPRWILVLSGVFSALISRDSIALQAKYTSLSLAPQP